MRGLGWPAEALCAPRGLEPVFFGSRNHQLGSNSSRCRALHIAEFHELLVLIHENLDFRRLEAAERQRNRPRLTFASGPQHHTLVLQCDREKSYRAPRWTKPRHCPKSGDRDDRFGVASAESRFEALAMAGQWSLSGRPWQGSVRSLCQAEGRGEVAMPWLAADPVIVLPAHRGL